MPSPYAYTVYTSTTSGQTDFQFTWPYIKEEHVKLYVNYNEISQGSGSSQFQVITNVSPKLVRLNTGLSSANLRVEVRRISSLDTPLVDYADGSTLTATDLDTSSLQSLYIAQELDDNQSRNVAIDTSTALPSLNNQRLTNVSNPTAAQDAATKSYVDTNDALQLSRSGGTMTGDIVTGGNRITGLPNPASASEPVTKSYFEGQSWSGSDTLESTDTWASNNSKIATTGAIDGRIDSVIESDVLAGTDLAKTASGGQVTINHSVSGANSTVNNSDGNVLQDITISAQGHVTAIGSTNLDSRYYTETELSSGGVLDSRYYTKTSADSTFYKLGSAGEIQSGETWSSSDSKVATTAAIDARITDLVDDVGGFVPIASETNFPTANPDVNNGAGTLLSIKEIGTTRTPSSGTVTIANGSGSNTVTITGCGSTVLTAGFGVIVETTSTLHTYSFHRLTPKATEVTTVAGISANITTVAGNTTNINSVASNATNINSVAGISSNVTTVAGISSNVTSVAGNETNINAVNSNSTNINLVAGSISNVNTVGGSIANVNTVATNISGVNSFGERYRVASSDPTSDLDEGDLVFNTTTNQLRVYNGSAWQGGVTATGDLIAKTGDTFSGAIGIIAGTTGSPGLYISGDTDTGIHSPGANTIALIASGSNILQAGSSGITVNGTATITGTLVADGLTVDGDAQLYGDSAKNLLWDKSDGALEFADDALLRLGTGNDLEIYHQASSTTNFIKTTNASAPIQFQAPAGEVLAKLIPNGAVELYHDGVKTFETDASGVKISGPEGDAAHLYMYADEGDDNADKWAILASAGGTFQIRNYSTGSWVDGLTLDGSNNATFAGELKVEAANPILELEGTAASSGDTFLHINANANHWCIGADNYTSQNLFVIKDGTPASSTHRFCINNSGNVGIGTTSPESLLHVAGALVIDNAGYGALIVKNNDDSADGAYINLFNDSSSPADNDVLGLVNFKGNDSAGNETAYANIRGISTDVTDGSESGDLSFRTRHSGTFDERMRIDSSGKVLIGTTTVGYSAADDLTIGNGSGNRGITIRSGTSSQAAIYFSDGTSGDDQYRGMVFYNHNTEELRLASNAATALTINSSQNATFAGSVSDSKGNLRSIPVQDEQSGAYTLVASDAGQCVHAHASTTNITVNQNVFSAGDAVSIVNGDSSDLTITQGSSFALRNSADASTGNRTLAQFGMATIYFTGHNVGYISGAGLS